MTIAEANRRLRAFDLMGTLVEIMQRDEGVLKQIQQDQLYRGEDNEGSPIRPEYYLDSYAQMKQAHSPSPHRDKYTPNLFLTGHFYSTIYVDTDINSIEIGSDDELGMALERKYSSAIYGLNDDSWNFYIKEHLYPDLMEAFRSATGF